MGWILGLISSAVIVLEIFNYFSFLIPSSLRTLFFVIGAIFAALVITGMIFKSQINITFKQIRERYCCQHCENLPEKLFRFTNYDKTVTIDRHGNGSIHHLFELLNDGENYIQRFPFKFSTTMSEVNKTLLELERDGEFKVKSMDNHNIRWDTIKDDRSIKQIHVVFDQKIKPQEKRKYLINLNVEKLFKTSGNIEWVAWRPIHFYEKVKTRVIFKDDYEVRNIRYCVKSPGKDPIDSKCAQLNLNQDEEGNNFVEIEERYPRINFEYRIEWDLPSTEHIH